MMMLALSVRQPWTDHLIHGEKRIENREWRTGYRGTLLLHAALKIERGPGTPEPLRKEMPTGAIIGAMRLREVLMRHEVIARYPEQERWAHGKWCWVFSDPVALDEPITCPGRLALFAPDLSPEKRDRVIAFLKNYSANVCQKS